MHTSAKLEALLHHEHRRGSILGFVFWTLSIQSALVHRLAQALAQSAKPVAVFDDEDRSLPRTFASGGDGSFRFFSLTDNRTAGREVGRYLCTAGHQSVAFITRGVEEQWATERLEGLRDVLCSDLHHGGVDVVRPVGAGGTGACAGRQLRMPAWTPVLRSVPGRASGEPIYSNAAHLVGQTTLMRRADLFSRLEGPLRTLARTHRITAWVAANDELALICMDVLRSCRRVPGKDVTVIGFDNTFESSAYRLSSYGFNEGPLVAAMLRHLRDRHWLDRFRRSTPEFSVPGELVLRTTTHTVVPSAPGAPKRHARRPVSRE